MKSLHSDFVTINRNNFDRIDTLRKALGQHGTAVDELLKASISQLTLNRAAIAMLISQTSKHEETELFAAAHALHHEGYYIGPRDASRNSSHMGSFMVCQSIDASASVDASTGGFCIVGDCLGDLIMEAFDHMTEDNGVSARRLPSHLSSCNLATRDVGICTCGD